MLALYALGGWLAAMVVMLPDDSWTFTSAWASSQAWHAILAGLLAGLLATPPLALSKAPWWIGLPIGVLVGGAGLWLYFFFWPHEWQAGRWNAHKSTGLFLAVYWKKLVPLCAAVGGAATAWAQAPVRPSKWERALAEAEARDTSAPAVQVIVTPPAPEAPPAGSPAEPAAVPSPEEADLAPAPPPPTPPQSDRS